MSTVAMRIYSLFSSNSPQNDKKGLGNVLFPTFCPRIRYIKLTVASNQVHRLVLVHWTSTYFCSHHFPFIYVLAAGETKAKQRMWIKALHASSANQESVESYLIEFILFIISLSKTKRQVREAASVPTRPRPLRHWVSRSCLRLARSHLPEDAVRRVHWRSLQVPVLLPSPP